MFEHYFYPLLLTAGVILLTILGFAFLLRKRRQKTDMFTSAQGNADPLLDNQNSEFAGRWGDQVVGKPRVVSSISPEERVELIHRNAEQHLMQQRQYEHIPTHKLAQKNRQHYTSIITLYVLAPPNQRFGGYDLYQALINARLLYGKMRIFHYHQDNDNQQPILFSVASAVNPGTIDVEHIGNFTTPGLTLFMDSHQVDNPKLTLETMIAVAEQLTMDLQGIMYDGKRQPWSTAVETECYTQLTWD